MKKILLSVIGILFIGVAGTLAWKALVPVGAPIANTVALDILARPTMLVVTEGQATVKRTDADAVKVTTELEVQTGDAIMVETTGKAMIAWADGSVSRLNGGADITITKAEVDDTSGAQTAEVEMRSGEMWTKVLNVVHDDTAMQVRAQSTVAGIRGTSVYTAVSSTGVIMMPFEHAIELRIGDSEEKLNLLEGEGATIFETKKTILESGSVMSPFITASQEADETYLVDLGDARRSAFDAAVDVDVKTANLPTVEELTEKMNALSGTDAEQEQTVAAQLDQIFYTILDARSAKDEVRLAEMTELYEAMVPFLEKMANSNTTFRSSLAKRVQLHIAVLLTDGISDEIFLTRQALAHARFALLDIKDNGLLRRVLRRELFLVLDLAKAGKTRQVEEVLGLIMSQAAFKKPLLDTALDLEKDLFEKITARIKELIPSMTGSLDGLRKQLTSEPVSNENTNEDAENANDNTNGMEEEEIVPEPVVNTNTATTVTPARQTNTNTAAAKPVTTTKPTTPEPKPVVTPPKATEPVKAVTPPKETLKPAESLVPVKVSTPVYRPVVTPAK